MNSFFIVLLNSFLIHAALANPNGAPDTACESMTPNKVSHGSDPQQTQSPYNVTTDKSYYKAGEPVKVTIESSGTDMFKGILVQARQVGKDIPIGTFSDTLPPKVKHLKCTGPKDSVTHMEVLNLTKIMLDWIPPANGMGNISFFATVVQKKSTFWVRVESLQLSRFVNEMATISVVPSSMISTYTIYMETLMINATTNTAQQSINNGKTTCAPEKCSAITFLPNTILVLSSAFLLFLA